MAISPRVRFIQKEKKRLDEKELKLKEKFISKLQPKGAKPAAATKSPAVKPEEAESSASSDEEDSEDETQKVEKDGETSGQVTFNFAGEDDEDDDILTVKKKHLNQSGSESESEVHT